MLQHILKIIPNRTLLALPLFLCLLSGCVLRSNFPTAVNGTLDLSRWDFEKDGIAALDGQWEFHWDRLLMPADFSARGPVENRAFFSVPGL
jgi:hypothetical protein